MSFKINGAIAVWENGKDGNDIAILNAKSFEGVIGCLDSGPAGHVDTHHLFAFMGLNRSTLIRLSSPVTGTPPAKSRTWSEVCSFRSS